MASMAVNTIVINLFLLLTSLLFIISLSYAESSSPQVDVNYSVRRRVFTDPEERSSIRQSRARKGPHG